MKTKRFHNIYDFENCNGKIGNKDAMRDLVEKIAKAIEMNILQGPIVAEGVKSNPGLSALAIIDFSHISVHTFTKYKEALVDVFSCNEYDRERVLDVVKVLLSTPETTIRQKEVWWGE
jgi:S-adenosylmethionine decarboxylase